MNLCRPDDTKSCAACCGLYNVTDGTRPALQDRLERRTGLFRKTGRTPDAIHEYVTRICGTEDVRPYDVDIHVCEFTGFVDEQRRSVGCMLHPCAPGNEGIDLRGMCHYGSMACKSFYCPAWDDLPVRCKSIVCTIVEDWHLYGLVVTDVAFVLSLFELVEHRIGEQIDPYVLNGGPARDAFLTMLRWKDSRTLGGPNSVRLSPYFIQAPTLRTNDPAQGPMDRLLKSLCFTFAIPQCMTGAEELVLEHVEHFARAYTIVRDHAP